MIKGWKKLTKFELEHLKANGCNNTVLFQRTINEQQKLREIGSTEPCWDCKHIAEKLGMKPEVQHGIKA